MFEQLTNAARHALVLADSEARKLGHNGVGPEHILLGILWMDDEPIVKWLATLGISPDSVRDRIIELVGEHEALTTRSPGYTYAGKQSLLVAYVESLRSGHEEIGVEQLLLGVIDDEASLAACILAETDDAKSDTIRAVLWMGVLEAATEVTGYLKRGDPEHAIKYASQMASAAKEAVTLFQAVLIGAQHYADTSQGQ